MWLFSHCKNIYIKAGAIKNDLLLLLRHRFLLKVAGIVLNFKSNICQIVVRSFKLKTMNSDYQRGWKSSKYCVTCKSFEFMLQRKNVENFAHAKKKFVFDQKEWSIFKDEEFLKLITEVWLCVAPNKKLGRRVHISTKFVIFSFSQILLNPSPTLPAIG